MTQDPAGGILKTNSTPCSKGKMATNRSSSPLFLWVGVCLLIAGVVGAMATAGNFAREPYLAVSVFAIISGVNDIALDVRRRSKNRSTLPRSEQVAPFQADRRYHDMDFIPVRSLHPKEWTDVNSIVACSTDAVELLRLEQELAAGTLPSRVAHCVLLRVDAA